MSLSARFFSVVKYVSLTLGVAATVIPILVVLFASFKSREEYVSTGALVPPQSWLNFENYTRAFTEGKMLLGFFNTFIIFVLAVSSAILLGLMISYILSRFQFKGSSLC